MRDKIKIYFPYFMIIILFFFTYNYSSIFINIDMDGYYGKNVDLEPYNFSLKGIDGKDVVLDHFKGKFVLLTFGFTKCTTVCPLNLIRFNKLSNILNKDLQSQVDFVFISFDELRDDEKELKTFINKFSNNKIIGLLKGKETGQFVAKKFHNYIRTNFSEKERNKNYQIDHNGFIYLIGPNQKIELIYMQKDLDEKRVLEDIYKLKNKE